MRCTSLLRYKLTVGIEIHAELAVNRKLFSPASTSLHAKPNSHVAVFDAALPGAQPALQHAAIVPAVRAALALGCEIQHRSSWDRKHYFWWDQPQGYQITQCYEPFAVNGKVELGRLDNVANASIGIKQVQIEQDTAKTVFQPPTSQLVDFNRVSHPLIEIVSLPHIHEPAVAVAFVRKVQRILKSVNACTTGMEMGGLRADVNVSVDDGRGTASYAGMEGLSQRTEIKNLSSLSAISAAITAERDRQIALLERGEKIRGETRGWIIGASTTHHIRWKEGEVDYRYMPDPDLGSLLIGQDLIDHLRSTLPISYEETVSQLTSAGVSLKEAQILATDDRCEYFWDVNSRVNNGKVVANWIVHEYSRLSEEAVDRIPPSTLASIVSLLVDHKITLPTAKSLLDTAFDTPIDVESYIDKNNLRLEPMTDPEYDALAEEAINSNPPLAQQATKQKGKLMWFVGKMIRQGGHRVQPQRAEQALLRVLRGT